MKQPIEFQPEASAPQAAPFDHVLQRGHAVAHDAVCAKVEQALHFRVVVHRPYLHGHAPRVGSAKEA